MKLFRPKSIKGFTAENFYGISINGPRKEVAFFQRHQH